MQLTEGDKRRIGNWRWRLQHLYRIRGTSAGEKIQFKPKPAQLRIAKWFGLWDRFLVLKARQVGISTLFLLWHLDATLFLPNTTTCILAHKQDSLRKLFRIIKIAYQSCPDRVLLENGQIWEKPKAKFDNANELYFEGLDSSIYVALEARSDTIHRLHVSEAAFIKNAEDVLTATFGAVPEENGIISIESTANGMGGLFFEMWAETEDEDRESSFAPFFVGYQDEPRYQLSVDDPEPFKASLTEEERSLVANHRHTLGNVAWRRRKLSNAATRKKFAQEFPANAEEAFLSSGRSPFDRTLIKDWIIRQPIEKRMEGRLLTWVRPIKGRRYIVGVDTSSGEGIENLDAEDAREGGTDYSVIQVWDCETMQLCQMFRGKWPYSTLHRIAFDVAKEYNTAYLAIEGPPSAHGLTVINNFVRDYIDTGKFPSSMMHTTEYVDQKSKAKLKRWGWSTTQVSRPLIIDKLEEVILTGDIVCYSRKVQSEFLRFEIKDDGKTGAMEGYHDDTVICAGICVYNIPAALKAGRMTATKAELGLTGM